MRLKQWRSPGAVGTALGVVLAAFLWAAPGAAQQAAYTAAQADAGAEVYRVSCSGCHGRELQGTRMAPELAGAKFREEWGRRPVKELMADIRDTMPPKTPKSLANDAYAAVTAYMLRANGVAPGTKALTFDSQGVTVAQGASPAAGAVASARSATGGAARR